MFFSSEGWGQEVAALTLVALSVLYMLHRFSGWPRRRPKASAEQTPDAVLLGRGLSRGLAKAKRARRKP